jgi:hypothetical protein
MGRWTHVRWTEAGQVTAILGWPPSAEDGKAPEALFDDLRAQGRDDEAALFLGQALPRFEVVTWAARTVRDLTPAERTPDGDALKAALLWLQDPSESRRRAAFDAAQLAGDTCPQRLCALAVFFSGGSLAPDNLQPVLAPKEVAGRFAAGAVLAAATASGRRKEALEKAFALGEALASGKGAGG